MDQAQLKALAAIQPFIYEANTAKSLSARYLSDLITRATSAPGTYTFTELLQTQAIQSLRAADTPEAAQAHFTLLEIFSWGTYEEYKATPNLPTLNSAQEEKLRQLTLLTLASPLGPPTTTNQLSYTTLLTSLSLPTPSSLESLITSSIYTNLLTARLSPTSNPPTIHITSVSPLRDLRPQSLPALLEILQTWTSRCDAVISDLESQISSIRNEATSRQALSKKRQEVVDLAVVGDAIDGGGKGAVMASRLRTRQGNKRDLDEQMEGEDQADVSSDDLRMDVDEGADVGGPRGGGVAGSSRGAKRNRGRG